MPIFELTTQYDIISYNLEDDVVSLGVFDFIKKIFGPIFNPLFGRNDNEDDIKPVNGSENEGGSSNDEQLEVNGGQTDNDNEDDIKPVNGSENEGGSSSDDTTDLNDQTKNGSEVDDTLKVHDDETKGDEETANVSGDSRKQEPSEIFGRRRKRNNSCERSSSTNKKMQRYRPKLICHKLGGIHYIELDVKDCNVAEVSQNGKSLAREADRYKLSNYSEDLEVVYEDNSRETISLFNDSNPLIFRLNKGWEGTGRIPKEVRYGHFLIFAIYRWELRGNSPVYPEPCADEKFQVHYIYRDEENDLPYFQDGDTVYYISAKGTMKLSGKTLFDDSTEGQLFIGDPPKLEVHPNITWVRVGEEHPGIWAENFNPNEKNLEEVLNHRQGHFFIRIFDEKTIRQDSIEFRYLRDIRKILIDGKPYIQGTILPPDLSKGYSLAKLQFVDVDSQNIRPSVKNDNPYATVNTEGAVLVDPHPDADQVVCSFLCDKNPVDIRVDLPRIWWRLENG